MCVRSDFLRVRVLALTFGVTHTPIDAQDTQHELHKKPHKDVFYLGLGKEFQTEFDADDCLCQHDGTKHPTLGSNSPASRVCYVAVVLP
uniref:Putative secreted protein n=1 Tax=Ixodes ricinus TaxID=34613 RepID=A0A6B0UB09_IXORI